MKLCPEIGVLFFAFFCCFGTTKFWINRHANQLRYMFWTKTKFPVIRPFVWIYRFRFTDGEQFIHRWCIGGRTHFNPFLLFLLRGEVVSLTVATISLLLLLQDRYQAGHAGQIHFYDDCLLRW